MHTSSLTANHCLYSYQCWNLKLQRVFLPVSLIFNADFKKLNAEMPFTPTYLELCNYCFGREKRVHFNLNSSLFLSWKCCYLSFLCLLYYIQIFSRIAVWSESIWIPKYFISRLRRRWLSLAWMVEKWLQPCFYQYSNMLQWNISR